jgi:NAD+ diphosphatase
MISPGSSLNRLSFLRTHHSFLSAALHHPSARFLLLSQLAPLTKSPSELFYVQYSDVHNLVPVNYFEKPEDDLVKDYDSRVTTPQLIFLGIDETSNNGDKLTWKAYAGVPYFALDVTPKGSHEQKTNITEVTEAMRLKGLNFLQTRVINTLPAEQGAGYIPCPSIHSPDLTFILSFSISVFCFWPNSCC